MTATIVFPLEKKDVQNGRKRINWEAFERLYLSREDDFKYEWVNGYVEKTPRSMDKNQLYIIDNLLDLFDKLRLEHKADGRLTNEIDTYFEGNHRRPDMAYFTKTQIRAPKTTQMLSLNLLLK